MINFHTLPVGDECPLSMTMHIAYTIKALLKLMHFHCKRLVVEISQLVAAACTLYILYSLIELYCLRDYHDANIDYHTTCIFYHVEFRWRLIGKSIIPILSVCKVCTISINHLSLHIVIKLNLVGVTFFFVSNGLLSNTI